MASVQDVINIVVKEIDESYISQTDKEVMNSLTYYIDELRGNGISAKPFQEWTFIELSKVAGSIALLKESLSEILPRYNRNAKICDNIIKLQKAKLRDIVIKELEEEKKKTTVDNVDAKMDDRLFKLRMKLTYLEEHAERVLYLWRSVNSLLDVIGQRINVLQSQKADVGVQENSFTYDIDLDKVQVDEVTGEITVD